MTYRSVQKLLMFVLVITLSGCATLPPTNISNSCDIFEEKGDWYDYTAEAAERWGVPIHVQLAIVHQESKFLYDARPQRTYLLGFIPWFRKSSAFGYAQVKDETWDWYIDKTGNWGADRDDFEDATDFIGWYVKMTHTTLGISKWDAYRQYLAYHEGHGGYKRGTYKKKPWLMKVARKVEQRAKTYRKQLNRCEAELKNRWSFWPF